MTILLITHGQPRYLNPPSLPKQPERLGSIDRALTEEGFQALGSRELVNVLAGQRHERDSRAR